MTKTKINTFLKSRIVLLGSVLVVLVSAWFLWRQVFARQQIRRVILISIDTCRTDYLGCYGCPAETTPNIDGIAQEAVLFKNAYTPVPLTLPAHSSMLTGTYPFYHGVHDNLNQQLAQSNITIAEVLQEKGYITGAIVSAYVLDSYFGLDQGFDTYIDRSEDELDKDLYERRGRETTDIAIKWLQEHRREKFFLFLHYFDPHTVYEPPEPFASRFSRNLYAGEIAYTDYCIGQVIDKLKELGLYESTLIIIVSDHGEMLGEHAELEHGYFLYQSAVSVPFIIKSPLLKRPKTIDDPVSLVDVVPTILGYLEIPIPPHVQGKDLSKYEKDKTYSDRDRYVFCESFIPTKYECNPLLGIVDKRFKYIDTTRPELYDLMQRPLEANNLIETDPKRARFMQGQLLEQIPQLVAGSHVKNSKLEMDAEARKRLESLGYVGTTAVNVSFELDKTKKDPKEMIGYHVNVQDLSNMIHSKTFDRAKTTGTKMLAQWPEMPTTHFLLTRLAFKRNDLPETISRGNKYLAMIDQTEPEDTEADNLTSISSPLSSIVETHSMIAKAAHRLARFDIAITHYQAVLKFVPDNGETLNNLAWLLAANKNAKFRDPDKAIELARQACELTNFDLPHFLDTLSVAYASAERFTEAMATAEKALRLAKPLDDAKLTEEIRSHLQLYKASQRYIEP